jgi:ATP-dependent Clp protease ATP-binding subunit ClpX
MIPVDTKNILFICGGAFDGLEKKIARRFNQQAVGFNAVNNRMSIDETENIMAKVTPTDLKAFGLIPEIIGRLPVLTYMEPLNNEALLKILKEPKNALIKQYQKLFEMDGINLTFDDDALEYIVEKTSEHKLGARGLRGIMEDIMTKAMFNMPSENINELTITLDYVKDRLTNK